MAQTTSLRMTCAECGYAQAVKGSKCPMCPPCPRCGRKLMHCECIANE